MMNMLKHIHVETKNDAKQTISTLAGDDKDKDASDTNKSKETKTKDKKDKKEKTDHKEKEERYKKRVKIRKVAWKCKAWVLFKMEGVQRQIR